MDPLEALRRRKQQLEQGTAPAAAPAPQAASAVPPPAPQPSPAVPNDGLDRLAARLDEQFSRLTSAVCDVRDLAQASAAEQAQLTSRTLPALQEQVEALQARVLNPEPVVSNVAPALSGPDLAQLSTQIRAVQDAIAAMPQPEAIKSLEDGYHHVLARLDGLKADGKADDKIDALYAEVTGLREVLDRLDDGGGASLVGEMRAMIAQLESDPQGNAKRIDAALENIKAMAQSASARNDPNHVNDAIGVVVERLVALEARIEALASDADDSQVSMRLDAIQSEMARLATFQDDARGLTSALDTIRQEMRAATPAIDMSGFDQRFSALDRIEQMTGGYAAQVAALSDRLNALDSTLASQTEMVHDVGRLSRQMDAFTTTLPVHEIEQSLLDLTSRVTALQEDSSTERLGLAVRQLGERVESCLKSIPKTEAIIQAVEAKLDSRLNGAFTPVLQRLDGVDARLEGLSKAISAADGPLIDHMSQRLEALIAAMPAPRADDALATLETQLAELNKRQSDAGLVSRDDVQRLHAELARARASVELGSNRDLQAAIVDQVRHLADHFDSARSTGDATLLPEIERQIEALADRLQSLGLFDPMAQQGVPDGLMDKLEQRLSTLSGAGQGVESLQSELVALREHASDQDQRMQSTLENVQTALETVIRRINAMESDEKAAQALADDFATNSAPSTLDELQRALAPKRPVTQPLPTRVFGAAPPGEPLAGQRGGQWGVTSDQSAYDTSILDDGEALERPEEPLDLIGMETASDTANAHPADTLPDAQRDVPPSPGDAQTLLRQLSGAMDATTDRSQRPGRSGRRAQQRAEAAPNMSSAAMADAASQRANFIAAARRAAQAAALQAGGGTAPMPAAHPPATRATMQRAPASIEPVVTQASVEPESTLADRVAAASGGKGFVPETGHNDRVEPSVDQHKPSDQVPPKAPVADAPLDPMQQLGGAAKTAHKEQKEKRVKEEKRQDMLSRAMLIALVLFTVGIGLFVVSLILPKDRIASTVIAPLGSSAPVAQEGALPVTPDPDADPQTSDVRVVGEDASADTLLAASAASDAMDDTIGASSSLDDPALRAPDSAISTGFERDRGPVMAQTPQSESALPEGSVNASLDGAGEGAEQSGFERAAQPNAALPPPANDMGPLLNPPLPALPAASADALPESIGSPRLRVAATSGDAAAQFEVATRFMEGRFVQQDLQAAAHWYGLAANQGASPAAYRLGSFYEQGRGVDRDRNGAIGWYERAALAGNPRAMHNLAVMAAEGASGTPDFSRAAAWFIPAANRGLSDSQFNLAVLYARGMGVERDLMESYKWFALAADAGDTEAVGRRDEVAGVLGEQALALARARVDNWVAIPVDGDAIDMAGPADGWDEAPVRAGQSPDATPSQRLVAEAQALLAQRGYSPGPADGLLGPRTNDAVRSFRQSVGLGDTDLIDQALVDALREGGAL